MRKLELLERIENGNSLTSWWKYSNPLKVAYNVALIRVAGCSPSLRLKNSILRLTGMKIGKGTRIGLGAMFDIFFPELIELGKNCVIGYNATILAHDYTVKEARKGRVKLGDNVLIGANATVLAGVEIGDGAVVSAMTLVDGNVPANSFVEGVPMKISKKKKK